MRLSLIGNCECSLISFCTGSCLFTFCDFRLVSPIYRALFNCSGHILLNTVSLPDSSANLFPTLITSAVCSNQLNTLASLIEITNSKLTNLIRSYPNYPILFTGETISQVVKHCIFHNVSLSTDKLLSSHSEYCILESSTIRDGSEGIYGSIVTGLTPYTHSSFTCFNTTFTRCTRTNTDYTGSQFSRIELPSSSHTFTSCTFSDITSTSTGGALHCNGTSATISITITFCSFTNCSCNSTQSSGEFSGGAMYFIGLHTCILLSSNMTDCSSSYAGGAIDLDGISPCTCVKDCAFTNCTADYGGGVCLYNCNATSADCPGNASIGTVCGCNFTSCSASKYSGGGLRLYNDGEITIRNCIFTECSAQTTGGAINWETTVQTIGCLCNQPLHLSSCYICDEWRSDAQEVHSFSVTPIHFPPFIHHNRETCSQAGHHHKRHSLPVPLPLVGMPFMLLKQM